MHDEIGGPVSGHDALVVDAIFKMFGIIAVFLSAVSFGLGYLASKVLS